MYFNTPFPSKGLSNQFLDSFRFYRTHATKSPCRLTPFHLTILICCRLVTIQITNSLIVQISTCFYCRLIGEGTNEPPIYRLHQQSCCYELLTSMQCSRAAIPAKNFTAIFSQYKVKSEIATRVKTLSLHIEDKTSHSFRPTSGYRNLT